MQTDFIRLSFAWLVHRARLESQVEYWLPTRPCYEIGERFLHLQAGEHVPDQRIEDSRSMD